MYICGIFTDPTLNWPKFLDSFAEIGGQMNSLMKNIKAESQKTPPLLFKRYITLPLFLSPDRDEELVKMTEGRVGSFSHDVVPHLLRTKPDPEVENRYGAYENRANSLAVDTVNKQLTTLEKVGDLTMKVINREKDDMDLKFQARNEMEKTTSMEDTWALVGMVSHKMSTIIQGIRTQIVKSNLSLREKRRKISDFSNTFSYTPDMYFL